MHLCLAVECIASSLHFCSTVCLFFNQSHSQLGLPPQYHYAEECIASFCLCCCF